MEGDQWGRGEFQLRSRSCVISLFSSCSRSFNESRLLAKEAGESERRDVREDFR